MAQASDSSVIGSAPLRLIRSDGPGRHHAAREWTGMPRNAALLRVRLRTDEDAEGMKSNPVSGSVIDRIKRENRKEFKNGINEPFPLKSCLPIAACVLIALQLVLMRTRSESLRAEPMVHTGETRCREFVKRTFRVARHCRCAKPATPPDLAGFGVDRR